MIDLTIRSNRSIAKIEALTLSMLRYRAVPSYTEHTSPLSDWYIPSVPSSTIWYCTRFDLSVRTSVPSSSRYQYGTGTGRYAQCIPPGI
ncbi:hypothetical protein BHM03_00061803, partial [Ensete ventricosum]